MIQMLTATERRVDRHNIQLRSRSMTRHKEQTFLNITFGESLMLECVLRRLDDF